MDKKDVKTKNLKIRMNAEDYEIIRKTSSHLGLSISAFCRIILKERLGIPEDDWDFGRTNRSIEEILHNVRKTESKK